MADKSVSTDSLAIEKKSDYAGKKFRVAMIGCGGIAQTHMNALRSMPDVEVVAGVDIDPSRLDNMKEKWGVTKLYKDWKTMLKEVKPDGVDVCTPNGVHMAPSIDALNAGSHVIVEKPMAMTPAECQKMIDAGKKAKKKLTIGFQYRYHPNTQFLKRAADAGQFGDIMFVRCQALRRRGIPNWGVFGQKKLQGGGPMIDIGVHCIEMAHYVMGSPKPVAATGNTWTFMGNKPSNVASMWPNWDHKTYTVEDTAIGHIRFDNGAVLHIEASFCAHIEKDVWNFQMMGTKGGCQFDPPMIFRDDAGTMINTAPGFLPGHSDFPSMFKIKLRNWIDACTKGTEQIAPGEAGLDVQKILDGVYRSAENGGKEVLIK
jgi:predicted dehydrogenase